MDLLKLLADAIRSIVEMVKFIEWGLNAVLDLFLHAGWAGVASLVGLWLTYWAARLLYVILGGKLGDTSNTLGFSLTRRVVSLCILAQFMVDILGHAYAVFRAGLPVTMENVQKYGARDFHAESWSVSLLICIVFGVYFIVKLYDSLKHGGDSLSEPLNTAIRRFSYGVALFASISSHMWWDKLLAIYV